MNPPKPKLCYVIPEYRRGAHTHFAYLTDFVKEISKDFDIFLLIEKGEKPDSDFGCSRVYVPILKIPLVSFLEIKMRLIYARFLGYKNFYVHYSFFSALVASFLGKVFYWNCGEPWKYKRNFFREQFERLVYRRIAFLVTGTEGMKRKYAEHYGLPFQKIKAMPNWLKTSNFQFPISNFRKSELKKKLNINSDQKIILFVHRLSKRKGAHYLPEIAKRLADAKNFVLLIIGDGPERAGIESKIKNYELDDKFRFLGNIPNYELPNYYAIADVFVLPSDEEGFPHVLLEAMAFGVPFAAFDVGGVREIIPPEFQKFVVTGGDVAALAEQILLLLSNENEKKKLVQISRKWIERYDISKVTARFREIVSF
ncbi:MAG TPA: glycosyltransferase family 4 protein [Candidatus Paceibacterota bacterium]